MDALRLNCGWYGSGLETSGQLGSVINACLAVASGLANHVLCFRSVWEGSAQGDKGRAGVMPGGGGGGGGAPKMSGFMSWNLVFSAPSAAIWIAMFAQRHFHNYGTTREQLAWIPLNARKNAELNPNAIYRDADVVRRLHERAHDLDAVLPLRLRRAVRRRDRGDRVAARARARTCGTRRCASRRSVRASRAGRRGTSSTICRRCRTATPASSCGRAPT